jgi:hypothetical protein
VVARTRVEAAGPRRSAAAVAAHVRFGRDGGRTVVGGRAVGWLVADEGVEVTHPPADGGAEERYVVGVGGADPAGGRWRVWACPGCGGRAADLYLVAGRDRLGCRRCCGLAYASQLTRVQGRKPRPGRQVVVETEVLTWTPATGWVRTVTRR